MSEIPTFKHAAQVRAMPVLMPTEGERLIDCERYVEGYPAHYEPYLLYESESGPVYERFARGCFDKCDMSDIIMQYNHAGRVLARQRNGSLVVRVVEDGLFCAADLGRTDAARQIYDDINSKMVDKMSWRFLLGNYYWDKDARTLVHLTVKKIFDVSAVAIPANESTSINARSWVDGVIESAARSEAELEERRQRLRIKINEMKRRI